VKFGRLIRVGMHRSDLAATMYVVAEPEPNRAIAILRVKLGLSETAEFEDLGRVTDALLSALKLREGQYSRT
jgi:hypothetical protein